MQKFDIDFYKKNDGSCPIIEFLNELDVKMRAKIIRMLKLLEQNGSELREPYSKFLKDGIFELRIKQGTDIVRVLYFFMIGHRIIITNGFVKKSQRTPRSEIELAKKYKKEYMSRKGL